MSELVNRRVALMLESDMYPTLPQSVRDLFQIYNDPFLGDLHGIYVGPIQEKGTGVRFPAVAIWSEFIFEQLTGRKYAHGKVFVDLWVSGDQGVNYDGRKIIGILWEYTSRQLQDTNWSSDGISVKRCYEIDRSGTLFEPDRKLYHQMTVYRVEATSATWY